MRGLRFVLTYTVWVILSVMIVNVLVVHIIQGG